MSDDAASTPPGGTATSHADREIAELEARLERTIRASRQPVSSSEEPSLAVQVGSAARDVVDRLGASPAVPDTEGPGGPPAVRDLLSSKYYLRQWGRLGMRNRSEVVDDFGLDPVYEQRLRPTLDFLFRRYFRVEVCGIENIPLTGRCLVIANHSGALPLDGAMLRAALRLEHAGGRELRWLAEDFIYHLPFLGAFIGRIGAVRACPENAERLLASENVVAVFPEGTQGIGKLYRDRYTLQRFGRGGFAKLALRTRTPIVPCAIIGAEESSPLLYRDELVSRLVGLPYIPVTPTFPALGPLGLLPAPTKWQIRFGAPLSVADYPVGAETEPLLVRRLADGTRAEVQSLLDAGLEQRKSVWFG